MERSPSSIGNPGYSRIAAAQPLRPPSARVTCSERTQICVSGASCVSSQSTTRGHQYVGLDALGSAAVYGHPLDW